MIEYSSIKLITADDSYREFSYQVKKETEGRYITEIWGWDENEQRDHHNKDWQQNRPQIITYDSAPIGTIAISENEDHIRIGQFFILPGYQNQGIGSHLLKSVLEKADRAGRLTRLASLKNNPAVSLYTRNGFLITGEKDYYYFMERKPYGDVSVRK